MSQTEDRLAEGFTAELRAQLVESIEFAYNTAVNDPDGQGTETDADEFRQVAQDALRGLMDEWPQAVVEAYERSPLKEPDYAAIALLFKRLSIRTKLMELLHEEDEVPVVQISTRKGIFVGDLKGIVDHEGVESVFYTDNGEDHFTALTAIEDLDVL